MSIDTFFLFYVDSVVRNDSMARKIHTHLLHTRNSTTETKNKKRHLLHTGNSTTDTDIKTNSCYVLETVELIPE